MQDDALEKEKQDSKSRSSTKDVEKDSKDSKSQPSTKDVEKGNKDSKSQSSTKEVEKGNKDDSKSQSSTKEVEKGNKGSKGKSSTNEVEKGNTDSKSQPSTQDRDQGHHMETLDGQQEHKDETEPERKRQKTEIRDQPGFVDGVPTPPDKEGAEAEEKPLASGSRPSFDDAHAAAPQAEATMELQGDETPPHQGIENPHHNHLSWWCGPVVQRQAWELQWLKARMRPPTLNNDLFNSGYIGFKTYDTPPPSFIASTLGQGVQKNAVYIRVPMPYIPMTAGPRPPLPPPPLPPPKEAPPDTPYPSPSPPPWNRNDDTNNTDNQEEDSHHHGGGVIFESVSWRGPATSNNNEEQWSTEDWSRWNQGPWTIEDWQSWNAGPWTGNEWETWMAGYYGQCGQSGNPEGSQKDNGEDDDDEEGGSDDAMKPKKGHVVPPPKSMPPPQPKAMPVPPRVSPVHPGAEAEKVPAPPTCPPPGHVIAQQFAEQRDANDMEDDVYEEVQVQDPYTELMMRLGGNRTSPS